MLVVAVLLAPTGAWAGKLTCLTGTDPSVANDLYQIPLVRLEVDAQCGCASFDGSKGKTHANYGKCTSGVISAQVTAGNLRTQCTATLKKDYSVSTCGVPKTKGDAPCIKTSAAGKVTCAITPPTKCSGAACIGALASTTCIDAADTNGDGRIDAGDGGYCNRLQFIDNGDGTITDNYSGLMWEKKDQAGGLHNYATPYTWAGSCGCTTGHCTGLEPHCQPDASAASACFSGAPDPQFGCGLCSSGCNVDPNGSGATTTIWGWLAQLNQQHFAGYSDWRIPTYNDDDTGELETIVDPYFLCFAASPAQPCVTAAFNSGCAPGCSVTGCSCTDSDYYYWSATPSSAYGPYYRGLVNFLYPGNGDGPMFFGEAVRAVRGP